MSLEFSSRSRKSSVVEPRTAAYLPHKEVQTVLDEGARPLTAHEQRLAIARGDQDTGPLEQESFLRRVRQDMSVRHLFDQLTGVAFFMKNRAGQIMALNNTLVERLGGECENDIVGTTDDDYFPPHIVEAYRRDDVRVLQAGQPLLGLIETCYTHQKVLDWIVTSKYPVFDADGEIIGVMGISRDYGGRRESHARFTVVTKVVEYIKDNLHTPLTVDELANVAHLSTRQLARRFHEEYGVSVKSFLQRTRIQAASEMLLSTDMPITRIAADFGYCDQSAFTKQFRASMGTTPHKYRTKYRSRPAGQYQESSTPRTSTALGNTDTLPGRLHETNSE